MAVPVFIRNIPSKFELPNRKGRKSRAHVIYRWSKPKRSTLKDQDQPQDEGQEDLAEELRLLFTCNC